MKLWLGLVFTEIYDAMNFLVSNGRSRKAPMPLLQVLRVSNALWKKHCSGGMCIQNHEKYRSDHAVTSLQPLAVGLVRVSWMASIVARGLRLRRIPVKFSFFQPICFQSDDACGLDYIA